MDETVDVDDSEMDRRLWMASTWDDSSSKRRRKYLCSLERVSLAERLFLSLSSNDLIKCLALLSRPSVVCLDVSVPRGTRLLRFSKHPLRWARLFFSSSLWLDLFPPS